MLQLEKKIIEWINHHIIHIAILFVIFAAAWMRFAGINYIGNDFHYSLYDIPGNCNSFFYRTFVNILMQTDYAITVLKLMAYIADFGVAALTLYLFWHKNQSFVALRTFLILSMFLLSPVVLLYSVAGMKADSICMCLFLIGLILVQHKRWCLSVCFLLVAALFYPIYWPIITIVFLYMLILAKRTQEITIYTYLSIALFIAGLLLSILAENMLSSDNYFWGKCFIINSATETTYSNPIRWLESMFILYGYFFASGSLLLAIKRKSMRIPALLIQILVVMLVGWKMTAHFAI